MNAIILNIEQRSPEWYAARAGRLTGSQAADMLARIKSGEAAARRNLRMKLLCERLTGRSQEDHYVSKEMQRGIDLEATALAAYEAHSGLLTRRVGFVQHALHWAGCSPDALVNGSGLVEIKCPNSATHLAYLRAKVLPREYMPQVRHNLWMTGAEWCDFVSFDDRFPRALQLFCARVQRTDMEIEAYQVDALNLLAEVDRELEGIYGEYGNDLN